MSQAKTLRCGIELLEEIDTTKIKSVQVNETRLDDGSRTLSVEVTFQDEDIYTEEITFYDCTE